MKQQRKTKQRQLILDAVKARCDHPSADQIYSDVRAIDDKISRSTVYRNLNVLGQQGKILHLRIPHADRFDFRKDTHYHLFCMECEAVSDVPLSYSKELDIKVAKESGYNIKRHIMIFKGICPDCCKKQV